MRLRRFGRNPGWYLTGVAAVVYGMVVAFGPHANRFHTVWLFIGALVLAALFLIFFFGAFVIWLFRHALGMYDDDKASPER